MSKQEEIKQALEKSKRSYRHKSDFLEKSTEYIAYLLEENDRLEQRNQELDAWATEGFEENQKMVVEIVRLRKELGEKERESEQWRSKYVSKVNLLRTTDDSRNELDRMYREALEAAHGFQKESKHLRSALETAQFHLSKEHYMSVEDAIVEALAVGQEGEGNQ